MATCGCGGRICECSIVGQAPITVIGQGSEDDPYRVGISYGGKVSCDAIVACVGDHLQAPLAYDGETGTILLKVGDKTGCDAVMACVCQNTGTGLACDGAGQIVAHLSADENNVMQIGADGGLFVSSASADVGITGGTAIDLTGDRETGYSVGVRISQDDNQKIRLGSDGGLYVEGPAWAFGRTVMRDVPNTLTLTYLDPVIDHSSGGFSIGDYTDRGLGKRVVLPKPGVWRGQMMLRYVAKNFKAGNYTGTAGAACYYAVSGAGRGVQIMTTVTRHSTVAGWAYEIVDSWGEDVADPSFGFHSAFSTDFTTPVENVIAYWSVDYIGPPESTAARRALAEVQDTDEGGYIPGTNVPRWLIDALKAEGVDVPPDLNDKALRNGGGR